MASNIKDEIKPWMEKFVLYNMDDKIKSQKEAYRKARPHTKKWKDSTVDSKASHLWKEDKIQARYKELLKIHQDEAIMSRGELLRELKKLFYIATGKEPTREAVFDVISGDRTKISDKVFYKINFQAAVSLAHQIAKLEGWETDKIEHSGKIDTNINFIPVKKG